MKESESVDKGTIEVSKNIGKSAAAIEEILSNINRDNITIGHAKELLRLGAVLTHRYFNPNENIRQKKLMMVMEDGASIDVETFWKDRVGIGFNDGWSIFKEI